MLTLQTHVKESDRELASVNQDTLELQLVADSLQVPDQKHIFQLKKLSLELDKMQKILELKTKADRNTVKMKLKQLDVREKLVGKAEADIEHLDQLNVETVNECLDYLEKVKAMQSKRIAFMMSIIDERVQAEEARKQRQITDALSTTGEHFATRGSSFAELLNNYDPEVRAMLERSIEEKTRKEQRGDTGEPSKFKKASAEAGTSGTQRQPNPPTSTAVSRTKLRDPDRSDSFESIDEGKKKPGPPNQYPVKGQDYLRGKG